MAKNIYCIGRNYAEHAKELGNEVPQAPVVFLKPTHALALEPKTIALPSISKDVHHEVELVLILGPRKSNQPQVQSFAVGIDLTARDLQSEAKKKGLPWVLAKGLKGFAPIGRIIPAAPGENFQNFEVGIEVDGQTRQKGSTRDLIFSIPTLLAYLDEHFGLDEGDLIFTGTPPGVSALKSGQKIRAWVQSAQGEKSELIASIS
ncbi:MAG: fumarylacetoacetate hydrolase family protein [Bdellovibrionales bacterium]|nr:fumarylacetoacetate hydrolase family protein [Bdellovibrionales bacterium]